MELSVLISTKPLEYIFSNSLENDLAIGLSDFNRAQLGILIEKHRSSYCLFSALEVCQYLCKKNEKPNVSASTLWNANASFKIDFTDFIIRFLNWNKEKVEEYFEWLQNVLRNKVLEDLLQVTGVDIHDSRNYQLRSYEYSSQYSSSGERVLHLEYEGRQLPTFGCKMDL